MSNSVRQPIVNVEGFSVPGSELDRPKQSQAQPFGNPSPSKQSPSAANGHKELLIPCNTYEAKDELLKIKNTRVFFSVAMMVSFLRTFSSAICKLLLTLTFLLFFRANYVGSKCSQGTVRPRFWQARLHSNLTEIYASLKASTCLSLQAPERS